MRVKVLDTWESGALQDGVNDFLEYLENDNLILEFIQYSSSYATSENSEHECSHSAMIGYSKREL